MTEKRSRSGTVVVRNDALSMLLVQGAYPTAAGHPSMASPAASDARHELRMQGLLDAAHLPTPLGATLARTVATASCHLDLVTTSPGTDRRMWLAGPRAVVAAPLADGRLRLAVVPRGEVWDLLVGWLDLGPRPAPPGRRSEEVSVPALVALGRALGTGDRAAAARLVTATGESATAGPDVLGAVVNGRARCWSLSVRGAGRARCSQLAVIDGGSRGWWRAVHVEEEPAGRLRLDPVDTSEVWRSVAEVVVGVRPPGDVPVVAGAAPVA